MSLFSLNFNIKYKNKLFKLVGEISEFLEFESINKNIAGVVPQA